MHNNKGKHQWQGIKKKYLDPVQTLRSDSMEHTSLFFLLLMDLKVANHYHFKRENSIYLFIIMRFKLYALIEAADSAMEYRRG